MRALLLYAAAGALALSACQRDPAPETTMDDAAMTESAPADDAAEPSAASSAPSSTTSAPAAEDAGTNTSGMASANEGGMMSGPSEATRDAAKEKAEQTNLHPRT